MARVWNRPRKQRIDLRARFRQPLDILVRPVGFGLAGGCEKGGFVNTLGPTDVGIAQVGQVAAHARTCAARARVAASRSLATTSSWVRSGASFQSTTANVGMPIASARGSRASEARVLPQAQWGLSPVTNAIAPSRQKHFSPR